MTDKSVSVSESVIFIANISVIGISVILHIGAPLVTTTIAQGDRGANEDVGY